MLELVDHQNSHSVKVYDPWDVIETVRARIHRASSQKALAQEWGISEQYLSDILRMRREPGGKVLKCLKLRKMVVYREIEDNDA